jgi:hypothetical protein
MNMGTDPPALSNLEHTRNNSGDHPAQIKILTPSGLLP